MRTLLAAVVVALLGVTPAVAQTRKCCQAEGREAGGIRSLRFAQRDTIQEPAQQPVVRAAGGYMNIGFDGLADFGWSSEKDVASLQRGDHDPHVRGFTVPNAEISLDGAVDPYFKGFANLVYKID